MRNVSKVALSAVLVLALGAGSAVMAKGGSKGGFDRGDAPAGMGFHNPLSRALVDVNLTDDQVTTLQTLSETFRDEMDALRDASTTPEADIASALSSTGFDTTTYESLESAKCQEMSKLRASHLSQIVNVLTAEQRTTLKTVLETTDTTTTKTIKNLGY